MAIDTRAKRASALNNRFGGPWGLWAMPAADGSIGRGDRAHHAGHYSGLPAGAADDPIMNIAISLSHPLAVAVSLAPVE